MNNDASNQALSVTDVNRYIKALFNCDEVLSSIAIRGEISNFKRHSAGHLYFTLKDDGGEISAVMFRGDVARMKFNPADGMRVVVYGNVDVYEKSGKYQVYVRTMIADGVGAMAIAYERLKRQLDAEGLFAPERKRPIPKLPRKIGVITAPTGAAIRDILNVTGRRFPQAEILIYPSLVQGADAPASLRTGVEFLCAEGSCDVIILGRGGGSVEDLWAFNDEALVRAVAAAEIPIISAVGHETDFTLCDFAADKRAPTPSAAAEIAVPDREALLGYVDRWRQTANKRIDVLLEERKSRVDKLDIALASRSPEAKLKLFAEMTERKRERLDGAIDKLMGDRTAAYEALVQKLDALNPLAVLKRGYGAVMDSDGSVIGSVESMNVGQTVSIVMSDGRAHARITSIYKEKNSNGGI